MQIDDTEALTFTFDVEDHRSGPSNGRYELGTRNALSMLDELSVRGTFFIVGEVVVRSPALVREIAASGHEIGLHGFSHINVTEQTPATFKDHVSRGKETIEDLVGNSVVGFRAPRFSIVRRVVWATEILSQVGYRYSSSVLPGRHLQFSIPEAPYTPFQWPSGLVELPVPVVRLGPVAIPYGGIYIRLLPSSLIRLAPNLIRRGTCLWTYAHPFELDPDEPKSHDSEWGAVRKTLHHFGRRSMDGKLREIVGRNAGPPLGERLARGEFSRLDSFNV